MKILKWCLGLLSVGVLVAVQQVFMQGLNIAIIHRFGYLAACLIFFAVNVLFVAAIFRWPSDRTGKNRFDLDRYPKLAKVLNDDGTRVGRLWVWFKKRGPAIFLPAVAIILTPFCAAIIIRALGFRGRKAWVYGIVSTAIAVVWSMSLSAGVLDRLKAWFT